MRYPEYLQKGGTIGFVAPSFGCATQPYKTAFDNAQRIFKEKGYKIFLGNNCYMDRGIGISNTPYECGKELTDAYCTGPGDVLISCGGGELMCEILEYVDFERIRSAEPKWFMGYSDNTNFTFLLTTLCDTASIYAPCAAAFGMQPWHPAIDDAFKVLTGKKNTFTGYDMWEKESKKTAENPLEPYNVTEKSVIKVYNNAGLISGQDEKITFSGRLLGGCLDCLSNLVGTKYDKVDEFNKKYADDGVIWFLESCDLNVLSMRRAMWQLDNAGWFKNARGFIIGRPYFYGQEIMGLDHYEAYMGILRKYNVPVIMDFDLGHLPPAVPMVCGSLVSVETGCTAYDYSEDVVHNTVSDTGQNITENSIRIVMNNL